MVVEYIRYRIEPERQTEFEKAYGRAEASLGASKHCTSYELSQGVEEPQNYVLRIEWDSVEGHENGFRQSAEFGAFLGEIKPFVGDIQEMRHYAPTEVTG